MEKSCKFHIFTRLRLKLRELNQLRNKYPILQDLKVLIITIFAKHHFTSGSVYVQGLLV